MGYTNLLQDIVRICFHFNDNLRFYYVGAYRVGGCQRSSRLCDLKRRC